MGWEGPITHRQYLAWIEWTGEEDRKTDLTHYYVMQTTAELRRILYLLSSTKEEIKISDFKLQFGDEKKEELRVYSEEPEYTEDGEEILQPPGVLTKEQVEKFKAQMAQDYMMFNLGGGTKSEPTPSNYSKPTTSISMKP